MYIYMCIYVLYFALHKFKDCGHKSNQTNSAEVANHYNNILGIASNTTPCINNTKLEDNL